jgi:hypothetical protein
MNDKELAATLGKVFGLDVTTTDERANDERANDERDKPAKKLRTNLRAGLNAEACW